MKVKGIKCKKCGDFVYSRARHDMRWCTCESCAIDGGQFDYLKITGNQEDWEIVNDVEIDASFNEMHDDWNYGYDKLGIIRKSDMTIKEIIDEVENESK